MVEDVINKISFREGYPVLGRSTGQGGCFVWRGSMCSHSLCGEREGLTQFGRAPTLQRLPAAGSAKGPLTARTSRYVPIVTAHPH